jgi:hypothetical protein
MRPSRRTTGAGKGRVPGNSAWQKPRLGAGTGRMVGKDPREQREIARHVGHGARRRDDPLLALRFRAEIA